MAHHSYEIIRALKDRVEKEAELSAKLLAHAIGTEEEAKSRFALLDQYRRSYLQTFKAAMASGLGNELYQNYQSFLSKLNDAIETQKKVVASSTYQVLQHQTHLQSLQKKKLSYEVLTRQADNQMMMATKKEDQKLMDEYAARMSRNNAMAW
jgi:flagellar FliJ protein